MCLETSCTSSNNSMKRRDFITIAALSMTAGTAVLGACAYNWWNVPSDEPYSYLSAHEAHIVVAISGAMFPMGKETLPGGKA